MEQGPGPFCSFGRAASVGVLFGFVTHKRGQEFPLFDTHEPFVKFGVLFKVLCGLFGLVVIFGIIEHGGTHTVLSFFAHEDLVVDAALAAGPEGFILGKLGVGNGFVTQFGVDLHDGQTGGEPEDFRFGVGLAAQFEYHFLYLFGESALPEGGCNNKTGVGDIFPMAPGFYITESGPDAILCERDHCFSLPHFLLDVFGTSFGDAGTPCLG